MWEEQGRVKGYCYAHPWKARPAYRHTAPEEAAETAPVAPPREYGLAWGAWNVRFTVEGAELYVRSLERRTRGG